MPSAADHLCSSAAPRLTRGAGRALLDLLHDPQDVAAEDLLDVGAVYPFAISAVVSFGSFDASSIPIGMVAPSKSEPRPTWSAPATFTA